MRKKIIAGNWKMNLTFAEAMALADNLLETNKEIGDVEVILAAPFIYLHQLLNRIQSSPSFFVAAQNCSDKEKGAYTGEVSATMLASIGIEHVILGHSERRQFYFETNSLLSTKVDRAIENGLIPIFCCGEMLDDRNNGKHFDVVKKQLEESIFHLDQQMINEVIIAYEPVWAIGTGVTATVEQAQEIHAFIRKTLSERYSKGLAEEISILYGGSVSAKNAAELFEGEDIDGALVGGASLKVQDFTEIISAMISKS
jgi:triosephosphate isomerase